MALDDPGLVVGVLEGVKGIFVTVDHGSTECLGIHAAGRATRFEALEPTRPGASTSCARISRRTRRLEVRGCRRSGRRSGATTEVAPGSQPTGPDLAVALTVKRARGQQLADRRDQRFVRQRPDRARPAPWARRGAPPMTIHRGPRCVPNLGHTQDAVSRFLEGETWRLIASTSVEPKGGHPPSARSWPRAVRSSWVRSPTLALRRPISRSRRSAGRVFSDASPAARKASRQAVSSAAITLSSRYTSSRPFPAQQPQHDPLLALGRYPPALARLRQRDGRAPPSQRPVPSCPSCSPPCPPSSSTRR